MVTSRISPFPPDEADVLKKSKQQFFQYLKDTSISVKGKVWV